MLGALDRRLNVKVKDAKPGQLDRMGLPAPPSAQ